MLNLVKPQAGRTSRIALLCLGAVLLLTVTLFLRGINDTSIGYPDGDRILMDGVFIHDFLRDMPVLNVFEYAYAYYAKYPALSIGYKPPLFPFGEAIFHTIFGIHMWSSRLALIVFALFGISAYFLQVRRMCDIRTAFFASCILVSTPFVAQWGWYTMLEIPTLALSLVTSYAFYRFMESQERRFLYLSSVLLALTAWTKQTGIFVLLWFLFYAAFTGRLGRMLRQRSTWVALAICVLLLVPLASVTIWLGRLNIAQSIGTDPQIASPLPRFSWSSLGHYFYALGREQLTLPVLLLSLLGIITAAWRKHRASLYFACLIAGTYVFFTLLNEPKVARYTIFWIPAFAFFAALPIYLFRDSMRIKMAAAVVLTATIVYQIHATYKAEPRYATGYEEAAKVALENLRTGSLLVDAYNNGYFVFFVRALDPEGQVTVIRGDKVFSSSAILDWWLTIHAHSVQDIKEILDKYGISLIVVEERDVSGHEIHQLFRSYLKTGDFKRIREIPIRSNSTNLKNNSIGIYRYLLAKPATAEYITIELPIVGQTLRVPLSKLTPTKTVKKNAAPSKP